MNLKSWVELERGRGIALARAIGVPPSFVTKMCRGEKPVPSDHALAIETASGGQVTRQELLPNTWHKYWPELAQAHVSIEASAAEKVAQGV